jgi:uncharacterized phage-like protein YoqJ
VIFTRRTSHKIACCFIGPTYKSMPFKYDENDPRCIKVKEVITEQILNMIETFRVTYFISSIGRAFDQFVAEKTLDLKKDYPHCTLECTIPYETEATWWTVKQRDRYFSIIERCDKETLIQNHYTVDCYNTCNEYMIRQSDYLLTVWDGRSGRTARAISLARKRKVHVITIDPDTLEVTPNIHIVR